MLWEQPQASVSTGPSGFYDMLRRYLKKTHELSVVNDKKVNIRRKVNNIRRFE